jgi:hypothetical protein
MECGIYGAKAAPRAQSSYAQSGIAGVAEVSVAKPRIFVSSTFYDLRHVRSALDEFITGLGFESVLSEKGDIAYEHDQPLDESCYREVSNCEIFVMVVGGRYGSLASGQAEELARYSSITEREFDAAVDADIPIYVLIEASVYGEYGTFKLNRENTDVQYAYVDSAEVFSLIDKILSKPRNNPVREFSRFDEIESWLREQWAGLFREYLTRRSEQTQLQNLATQVEAINEVTKTLRTYMETVVSSVAADESHELIATESKRLDEVALSVRAASSDVVRYLDRKLHGKETDIVNAIVGAATVDSLLTNLEHSAGTSEGVTEIDEAWSALSRSFEFMRDVNDVREMFSADPLPLPPRGSEPHKINSMGRPRKKPSPPKT